MAPTASVRSKANRPTPEEAEALVEKTIEDANAARQAKPEKKETVQQLKNRLRNEAEREVLDAHKPEVIKLTAAKYKKHNLEYIRRLTEEEKAAKAIEEYYQKFPNLRPVTVVKPEQGQGEPDISEYTDVEPDTEGGE